MTASTLPSDSNIAEDDSLAHGSLSATSRSGSDVSETREDSTGRKVHFKVKGYSNKTSYADKVIYVQKDFVAKEGVTISDDLVIHKFLAGGYQGGIYTVAHADGTPRKDVLLKILKPNAVLGDLEKEWAIGQALNVLSNEDGYLPGFMKTLDCIRVENEHGLRGMLIERLNGKIVEDTVSQLKFNDIRYVRDMLYQVFKALDRAYTVLGFKHADLRLTNIMEHYPDPNDCTKREFKIIDYGLSSIQERHDSPLYKRMQKNIFNKMQDPEAMKRLFIATVSPASHFSRLSAAVYKMAWLKHGDVYHVLASLSHYVDDKSWAEEDKPMVEAFAKLMLDVTGIHLRRKFKPRDHIEAKKAIRMEEKEAHHDPHATKHHLRGAAVGSKHFVQRIGSQMSMVRKSNICACKALRYPLFRDMALVSDMQSGTSFDIDYQQLEHGDSSVSSMQQLNHQDSNVSTTSEDDRNLNHQDSTVSAVSDADGEVRQESSVTSNGEQQDDEEEADPGIAFGFAAFRALSTQLDSVHLHDTDAAPVSVKA